MDHKSSQKLLTVIKTKRDLWKYSILSPWILDKSCSYSASGYMSPIFPEGKVPSPGVYMNGKFARDPKM